MNKLKYIHSILLLLSVTYTQIGFSKQHVYHRNSQLSIEKEKEKNSVDDNDNNKDIELSLEDQNYIDSLLVSNELYETENKTENVGLRGPGPCVPLPAEFPVHITKSVLGSVAFGQTHSHDIRFHSPMRRIEAGDLVLIHTLPNNVTLLSINENQPQTRRIVCNRTSFSVCIRRDSTRDRYKICLVNNQAIEANTEIAISFIVRAPRRPFTIISKTALQARPHSGRVRHREAPVIVHRTHVGNATGIPVVKTDTSIFEALSA
jgi:hypothetical protein